MTCEGQRDILGLWAGDGGEGAKHWLHVLTELRNRGVGDVLMIVCDGLTGLPDAIATVWPQTITQTCVVHLLRNSFRYAGRQHWDAIAKALPPVYIAPTEAAALERFPEVLRGLGPAVSGDRAVVGERLGRVRAVPGLRCRDPRGHLLDERDRVGQCPYPSGGQRPRTLPERVGRAEVRLPSDHERRL